MEIDFHVRVAEYLDALSRLKELKGEKYSNKVINHLRLSMSRSPPQRPEEGFVLLALVVVGLGGLSAVLRQCCLFWTNQHHASV